MFCFGQTNPYARSLTPRPPSSSGARLCCGLFQPLLLTASVDSGGALHGFRNAPLLDLPYRLPDPCILFLPLLLLLDAAFDVDLSIFCADKKNGVVSLACLIASLWRQMLYYVGGTFLVQQPSPPPPFPI